MILMFLPFIITGFCLFGTTNTQLTISLKYNPDAVLSVPELVRKSGYPVETHTIQTEDNYLLTVHRIPFAQQNAAKQNRIPIFLMHGILSSSADWIYMGSNRSLAYLLADLGYDVWIGNARGNKYSRNHAFLDPDKDAKFWDFSWHEIGMYDLPATIDYILDKTNNTKIRYIGHSQGCTSFFVMASMRPEYNKKIIYMIALAPAVFMARSKHFFVKFAAKHLLLTKLIFNIFRMHEFLPNSCFLKRLVAMWCNEKSSTQYICEHLFYLVAGYDENQMDRERLPVIISNTPAGSSIKQFVHYFQNAKDNRNLFRLYDYGPLNNLKMYNSINPPEYPLKRVTAPVVLFSSYNDIFVNEKDVDKLASILPNVVLNYHNPYKNFTHLDYLCAKNVATLINSEIIKILKMLNEYELYLR